MAKPIYPKVRKKMNDQLKQILVTRNHVDLDILLRRRRRDRCDDIVGLIPLEQILRHGQRIHYLMNPR